MGTDSTLPRADTSSARLTGTGSGTGSQAGRTASLCPGLRVSGDPELFPDSSGRVAATSPPRSRKPRRAPAPKLCCGKDRLPQHPSWAVTLGPWHTQSRQGSPCAANRAGLRLSTRLLGSPSLGLFKDRLDVALSARLWLTRC